MRVRREKRPTYQTRGYRLVVAFYSGSVVRRLVGLSYLDAIRARRQADNCSFRIAIARLAKLIRQGGSWHTP